MYLVCRTNMAAMTSRENDLKPDWLIRLVFLIHTTWELLTFRAYTRTHYEKANRKMPLTTLHVRGLNRERKVQSYDSRNYIEGPLYLRASW